MRRKEGVKKKCGKYSDEVKEKAYARYSSGESVGEISKKLGVPDSTLRGWFKKMADDGLASTREEKQKAFIDRANRVIDKGMELLEKRFDGAISQEQQIREVIEEIAKSSEEIISDKAKADVIKKLRELQVYDLKGIAVVIGTVYDRRDKSEERSDKKEGGGVIFIPNKLEEE